MPNLLFQYSRRRWWLLWLSGLVAIVGLACGGVEVQVVTPTALPQPAAPTRPSVVEQPTATSPAAKPRPTKEQATEPAQEPSGEVAPKDQATNQNETEWTVMLYQDADDEILEQDIMIDFNEAEFVGSSDRVNLVAQVDRYRGAYKGMGNWTGAKRFYLTPDRNLNQIGSQEVADLGEVNMADGDTLVDFITWAVKTYPARKYALIMSDHGAGWPGGWTDPAPGGLGRDKVVMAQLFGMDGLWLMELDRALTKARQQTGLDKFELIGFDACLMGQLEVFTALEPHARYAVASQEVEPALGWAYGGFLAELVKKPQMDGAELSKLVVESYIDYDLRILDDESRRDLVAQEFNFSGETTPQEVAEVKKRDVTLTAVDLSAIPGVNTAVDNLATALAKVNPKATGQARAYAQSFESIFGQDTPSPYIDLGNFAQLVTELSRDSGVADAAEQLFAALKPAILAEKHGSNRPGSTGITIYFPTAQTYGTADDFGYTTIAERFAQVSKWDEYLYFFHTGQAAPEGINRPRLEAEPVSAQTSSQPPAGISQADWETIQTDIASLENAGYEPQEIPLMLVMQYGYSLDVVQYLADNGVFRAAGGGASRALSAASIKPIQLAPLTLSAELATITTPVKIQTEVSGDRLAYVYSFIGRFLPRENALLIEDIDYLNADESQTIGGVTYPVWPEGGVNVEFDWEPTVYAISDGKSSVKALFEPVAYDPETPTYAVGGTYRFASGGASRFAKMYFRDNAMTEVFGYTSGITQAVGAPRQIVPQPGDQFTVLERGDDLSLPGNEGREKYVREGGTLTFGETPFTLETTPAPSGNYVVGVIAEDLDGRKYEQYEGLFVLNEQAAAVDGFKPYVNEDLGFALLYPEKWQVEAAANSAVNFSDTATSALVTISRRSYPNVPSPAQANSQAIQDVIDSLNQNGDFENLQFLGDVQDYVLGAYDGQTLDFAYDLNGQPYYGYAVASTPVASTTYVVLVSAPDAKFDSLSAEFDDMLYSFDILISGVSKEQIGPPPPAFASELFADDFSNPAGGLINDEKEQDWGRGYYSSAGRYVFELKPAPGAIYDYYPEQKLPADFLLQATASYTGAVDNAYGLIFRVQAGKEGDDFYAFRVSGDGFYTVEKTEGQQMVPLIDWTASSLIEQKEGGVNVLTVAGQSDAYRFYINGKQVGALTDATYKDGTFGLIVDNFDETHPAHFTFEDLKLGRPGN